MQSVKRYMGEADPIYHSESGTPYRPVEIAALLLERLEEDAEMMLGEPVEQAVPPDSACSSARLASSQAALSGRSRPRSGRRGVHERDHRSDAGGPPALRVGGLRGLP
ncbi:hypothetical protein ACFYYH_22390 [Streptomyces sp. NPDC002018]|uniref:hypothetical protein n=1 Tax=Streptomyces sp. NPDC002018 TaxID=3364629 RepID=UPI003696B34A